MTIENRLINLEDKMMLLLERTENITIAQKGILTFSEAADYLGVAERQLHKMNADRAIPFSQPSKKVIRYQVKDLNAWLLSGKKKSSEQINENAQLVINKIKSRKK